MSDDALIVRIHVNCSKCRRTADYDAMKIQLLFFARARELAGTTEAEADVPEGSKAGEAMQMVLDKYPDLKEIEGKCVLALNHNYLEKNSTAALKDGDEIAIIPPISGG